MSWHETRSGNGAPGPSREVRESFRELVALRRRIHQYPEPGFKEERTAAEEARLCVANGRILRGGTR